MVILWYLYWILKVFIWDLLPTQNGAKSNFLPPHVCIEQNAGLPPYIEFTLI